MHERSDYADFCGKHQFNFDNIDINKADSLADLISKGSSVSELLGLFDDHFSKLEQTTAYLFSINTITREQIATIFEYGVMLPHVKQIRFFDRNDELTHEATHLLQHFMSPDEQDKFVALLKEKPRSEQCYFQMQVAKEDLKNDRVNELIALAANNIKIIKKDKINDAEFITVFSVGARDAMTEAIYAQHAKTLFPRSGKFTKDDIERSMEKNARYSAVYLSGIENEISFHRIKASFIFLILHDEFHRRLISTIPKNVYEAFLYAINVVREKTDIHWSKEIWESVDMEVGDFINDSQAKRDKYSDEKLTKGLVKLMLSTVYTEKRQRYLFDPSFFNDTAWLLAIDLILNNEEWKKLQVSVPTLLLNPHYKQMLNFVERSRSAIVNESSPAKQVAILKSRYFNLPEVTSNDVQFGKLKKSNYIQVLVDGKPLVMSKEHYIKFKEDGINVDRMARNRNVDVENIVGLSEDKLKQLKSDNFVNLILWEKFTIAELKDFSAEVIERLNNNRTYQLLKEDKITMDQVKTLSAEDLKWLEVSIVRNATPSFLATMNAPLQKTPCADEEEERKLTIIGLKSKDQ